MTAARRAGSGQTPDATQPCAGTNRTSSGLLRAWRRRSGRRTVRGGRIVEPGKPTSETEARLPGEGRGRGERRGRADPQRALALALQPGQRQHPADLARRIVLLRLLRWCRWSLLPMLTARARFAGHWSLRTAGPLARLGRLFPIAQPGRTPARGARLLGIRRRLDLVLARPLPALLRRQAATAGPALLGALAAAGVVLAGERLIAVRSRRGRQRQRQVEGGRQVAKQCQPGAKAPRQSSPAWLPPGRSHGRKQPHHRRSVKESHSKCRRRAKQARRRGRRFAQMSADQKEI